MKSFEMSNDEAKIVRTSTPTLTLTYRKYYYLECEMSQVTCEELVICLRKVGLTFMVLLIQYSELTMIRNEARMRERHPFRPCFMIITR